MAAKIEVTCPKCLGSKYFAPYAHIAGGACFTCSGNGTILVYPGAPGTIPAKSTRPEKTIELDTLGMVTISKWGTGSAPPSPTPMLTSMSSPGRSASTLSRTASSTATG